jgi:predicted RNA-binding protein (virulence factor B family)
MDFIKLGQNYIFNVVGVDNEGYILRYQNVTLKMPKEESETSLKIGDFVDGFVFIDQTKSMTVTLKKPLIDTYRAALVEVVEVKEGLGVFVNIGLSKDMLVSKDDLPFMKKEWPDKGDHLFCYLKGGKNQIIARLVSRFRMKEFFKPETALELNDSVEAYVFYITDEGFVLFTETGHEIFVFYKNTRNQLRLGEKVTVKITVKKDDRHYNGTLNLQKELIMSDDATRILDYLKAHQGKMPYTDKSSPEDIFKTFNMSKASFKRALGSLYKDKQVLLEKNQTVLVEND